MKISSCLLMMLTIFCFLQTTAQESIGRRYKLLDCLDFKKGKILLVKEEFTEYEKLNEINKKKVDAKIKLIEDGLTESIKFSDKNGNEIIVNSKIISSPEIKKKLLKTIAIKQTSTPDFVNKHIHSFKGNVLFEKNKLYANPWNFTNWDSKDDKKELFYKLSDGKTARLSFAETTLTSIVIPIKYRFKGDEEINVDGTPRTNEIDEAFTTAFNVSFFLGRSWGLTKFNHRLKVGNKVTTHKHSLGGFIGTGAETLSLANTDRIKDDTLGIDEESEVKDRTIGFLSLGGGYVYSRNKFAFSVLGGFDFGVGEVSKTWDYNNRLWIGFGIGYDIFKIQIGK